jgi:hypothetical protein
VGDVAYSNINDTVQTSVTIFPPRVVKTSRPLRSYRMDSRDFNIGRRGIAHHGQNKELSGMAGVWLISRMV